MTIWMWCDRGEHTEEPLVGTRARAPGTLDAIDDVGASAAAVGVAPCVGHALRLVRSEDRAQAGGTDPEVVFGLVPATGVGADESGCLRPRRGRVVERLVQVPVERMRAPRRGEWPALLRQLAAHLDDGRVYSQDLPELTRAADELQAALGRRTQTRRRRR